MAAISKQILYKNILKHLKTNPYGLSSTDLARNLNINRMTLVKYLNIMQANGLIEYRNIGMAKVWHITSKYDLINSILRGESAPIQAIIAGQHIKIRNEMGDMIPLSLFRVIKAALSLSKNPSKTQY
ncbi:winged helix-turn-helix transcriptional regulator, partial [archaeon]|nr:winged helix-turn-helix transcriptional regulator [archaeon]